MNLEKKVSKISIVEIVERIYQYYMNDDKVQFTRDYTG